MLYKVIYIMGVSGSGKTTIGKLLADKTGYPFYDADDFHSNQHIAKMHAGAPLTDEDRWPWLDTIHDFVKKEIIHHNIILVCSALKQVYRERLCKSIEANSSWIYLAGDYTTILNRLQSRNSHYMPASLLQSQFDALEIPEQAICIDIQQSPEEIVATIILKMGS
jgi:carbohydrate kinase (thermoresistant glucokinase family)